jgi:opacity protein-like surface antigen
MWKFLFSAVCAVLIASSALAADMPVKAPPGPFATVSGYGWYFGVGTEAGVAQSSVTGNNLFATSLVGGNLTASGGAVTAAVGYIRGNNQWRWRLEATGAYQNITGATPGVPGAGNGSVASRWSATQGFDISFEVFKNITAVVGNLGINFPSFDPGRALPANIAVSQTPWQYVGVRAREFGLDGSFGAASGSTWGVAPQIETGFLWQTLDAAGKPNGGALDAYFYVAFPEKGATFGNVFATNGAPITVGAGANLGRQYGAGLRYNFGGI